MGAPAEPRDRNKPLPPISTAVVWRLAWPSIVEQLLAGAIGLTDTIIAGHLPGAETTRAAAAAAVGTMNYLQWFTGVLTAAFAVGSMAIVARSIGARRVRVANRVAGTSLSAAFCVGLIVAIFLFAFAPQVAHIAGLQGQAAIFGQQYLRIMVITIALSAAGQVGMASLRGAGDTVRPMLIMGAVAAINILTTSTLSLGLFGLPALGIQGNALGTMIAYLVGGTATMIVLLHGIGRLKLERRHFRIVPHVLLRVLRISLPSSLEQALLWIGQFGIVIWVIAPNDNAIGVDGATMAAHTAVLRLESLAFLPGFGFGIATSALVGQYLGAGRPAESRKAAFLTLRLAVIFMTIAAIPMVIIPAAMLSVMVDSSAVAQTGLWPMVLAGLAQPGFAVAIIMGFALRGAGATIWPMLSTIAGMFVVRMPIMIGALWLFKHYGHYNWGLTAVWIGIFADLNSRAVFNTIAFLRGSWQTVKV